VAYDFRFGICPTWPLPAESMNQMEVPIDHDHYGLLILKCNPALYNSIIIYIIILSIYSKVVKYPQVAGHLASDQIHLDHVAYKQYAVATA
jgi:hypothetical protein